MNLSVRFSSLPLAALKERLCLIVKNDRLIRNDFLVVFHLYATPLPGVIAFVRRQYAEQYAETIAGLGLTLLETLTARGPSALMLAETREEEAK